jgi:hypothetical protein
MCRDFLRAQKYPRKNRSFPEIYGKGIFKFEARCFATPLQPGRLQTGKNGKSAKNENPEA